MSGEGRIRIPNSTYRLQFNRGFTFSQAAALVPYLRELGIGDCYASPYMKARPGSMHGYDIIDHNSLNPEIGDAGEYERFVEALHRNGMGQLLDIVPNHMGVGSDNEWWLDVLENGPSSVYAQFFDIDWNPNKPELRGKVLLPVLGDHYRIVLEGGQLGLTFDAGKGTFSVNYYENRYPMDPKTYPRILGHGLARLKSSLGEEDEHLMELESLTTAFRNLPEHDETEPERVEERNRDKEVHKRRLARLCVDCPEVTEFIEHNLRHFNGETGVPESFDPLHELLEEQAYRLTYWRVAADEINYRRFFNINELAGLRIENEEVFEATHQLILQLVAEGKVNGLRVDHPDGLYDPAQYFLRLQRRAAEVLEDQDLMHEDRAIYLAVEKILAGHEHLREDWLVHGTTGYEFANLVNGLFVDPDSEKGMDRIYRQFIGRRIDFEELLYERKKLTMRLTLASELNVLARRLNRISESRRRSWDFTFSGLRDALAEVVASFPVYRTYITGEQITEEDRRYVDWAVARAKKRSPAADVSIFDFIRDVLLLETANREDEAYRATVTEFVMKFQQYTGPVTAKSLEDSTLYIYNRLVSLNEVGGEPDRYGVSVAAFHHLNQERAIQWPHAMLSTSTHDTKRSEDVRARINVLSEVPGEWRVSLGRWRRLNHSKKREVDGGLAPSRNDEYLLYQTLLGAWPTGEVDEDALAVFRERIEAYMLKAVREAQVHTSWIKTNVEYEEAISYFVNAILSSPDKNFFLQDFIPFQRRIAVLGMLNSLSQTLLKLTSPGVPDIYQGNEIWDFSLVDPDNRRPVDYGLRQELLSGLKELAAGAGEDLASRAADLFNTWEDGRPKFYLTWRALTLRNEYPEVFREGEYLPLEISGERQEHLAAFARRHGDRTVISVAPRLFARLVEGPGSPLFASGIWGQTWVEAPDETPGAGYLNVLTGEHVQSEQHDGRPVFSAAELLKSFPVALLVNFRQ